MLFQEGWRIFLVKPNLASFDGTRPVARFLDRAIRPIDDYLELMASGGLIGCARGAVWLLVCERQAQTSMLAGSATVGLHV